MASSLYKLGDEKSRYYVPAGSNIVNVVENYAWCLNQASFRTTVPTAYLTEWQQDTGQVVASFLHFFRQVASVANNSGGSVGGAVQDIINVTINGNADPSSIYQFKYLAKPTGFEYLFPYFGDLKSSRTNSFDFDANMPSPFQGLQDIARQRLGFGLGRGRGESKKTSGFLGIFETVTLAGEAIQAVKGIGSAFVPGKVGLEDTKSWRGTSEGTYDITFDLFNTHDADSVIKNRDLIHLLEYQNTSYRRNLAVVDPPVIYSLHIPDIVSMPACYMSSLNVSELGMKRMVTVDGIKRVVPEAYRVSMTFDNLLEPARNILLGLDSGDVVKAIGTQDDAKQFIYDAVRSTFPQAVQAAQDYGPPAFETILDIIGIGGSTPATPTQ